MFSGRGVVVGGRQHETERKKNIDSFMYGIELMGEHRAKKLISFIP